MSAHGKGKADRTPAWPAVRALFEQCLDAPVQERTALLAAADPAVRTEAAALLREIETNPDHLDPDFGHRALVASAEQLLAQGRTIGGYRILEVLDHGGMSTVYLAEQEHPRRRVALKLLAATVTSNDALHRFRNEGELLARLQHPGIAQIYAAGLHEEQTAMGALRWPYLVMEYIEGSRTLGQYVRETTPSQQTILELFLQICQAVQHAHERGVVHRDLKPANVLVDEHGATKVIDFGIARSIAESRVPDQLTQPGDVIGTLHYMSPEQVRGDAIINTRSDVHALGTVLFELLTGELPFDFAGQNLPEVGRTLTEVEAKPLRRVLPDADTDLELIIGRALAKHPDQRYSTAGALAEDLHRYLDSEPINARPPSLRYQLRMFARRRRGFVTAALTVLLVSLIGGVSSLVYAVRAHNAEQLSVAEGKVKDDALRRTFDMTVNTVLDLPSRLEGLPRATEIRRTLINAAAEQLAFVEQNLPIEGDMLFDLARAYYNLAGTQLGDAAESTTNEAATQSLQRCEHYIASMLAADPANRLALHLRVDCAFRRGLRAFNKRRDMEQAEMFWAVAKSAIDRLDKLPPLNGRDLRRDHANYENCLAMRAVMDGDTDREIAHLERCREIQLERHSDYPDSVKVTIALASICERLGHAWSRAQDPDRALELFAEATRLLEIADEHPQDTGLRQLRAKIRNRYGYTLAENGNPKDGAPHLRWSWKELLWLHERDPNNAYVANSFALASSLLGEHLVRQAGDAADAVAARELYIEAKKVSEAGFEVAERLIERSRDMQSLFVSGVCRGLIENCNDALQ